MHVLTPEAIPVGETKAVLGEGAFWSGEDDALLWVDILGKKVFRTHPDSGRTDEWSFPEQTAFVQPADDGTWLVGQQRGIVCLDPATGRAEDYLAINADDRTTRTNDAGCDRQGRLFVGTMRIPDFALEPVGPR